MGEENKFNHMHIVNGNAGSLAIFWSHDLALCVATTPKKLSTVLLMIPLGLCTQREVHNGCTGFELSLTIIIINLMILKFS